MTEAARFPQRLLSTAVKIVVLACVGKAKTNRVIFLEQQNVHCFHNRQMFCDSKQIQAEYLH